MLRRITAVSVCATLIGATGGSVASDTSGHQQVWMPATFYWSQTAPVPRLKAVSSERWSAEINLQELLPSTGPRTSATPDTLASVLAQGYNDIVLQPGIYTEPIHLSRDARLSAASSGVIFAPVTATEWIEMDGLKMPLSPDVAGILVIEEENVTFDGPESDLAVPAHARALALSHSAPMISVSENARVYLEGITVYGGTHNLYAKGAKTQVIAKDCKFGYPVRNYQVRNQSAISLEGASGVFMQCEVFGAPEDGIDARGSEYLLEIDVHAYGNGRTGTRNNGSTMHAGGKVIRIGGRYEGNRGPNLGDHGAGTQSLNIGVRVNNSVAPEPAFRKGIASYAGANVWITDSPTSTTASMVSE